jgi:hypothetical protein
MRPKLTYANVVATLALFIALGGASYAAIKLPKNSVGTKQLKRQSVTSAKIKKGAITAAQVMSGSLTADLFKAGQLPQSTAAAPATAAYVGSAVGPFTTNSNGEQTIIATVSIPSPGAYTLMADGFAYGAPNEDHDQTVCSLFGPGDQGVAGMPSQLTLRNEGFPLVIVGAAQLQAGTLQMRCTQIVFDGKPDTITYINARIVATRVDSLANG